MWAKQKQGFTIVELLIVIVVIAILAAISIVAYNGIQTRAENNKTISAVAAYTRAITVYAADNSIYPVPAQNFPCLGTVSYCANVTDTAGGCDGSGRAGNASYLNSTLSTTASNLPSPSTQAMDCNGKQYSGAYYAYSSAGKVAQIRFYLRGNEACNSPSGTQISSRYQNSDTTVCNANFPTLP